MGGGSVTWITISRQVNGVEGGHFKMVLLKQSHDMTARLQ